MTATPQDVKADPDAVLDRLAELRRSSDRDPAAYVVGWLAINHADEVVRALDSFEASIADDGQQS